VAAPWRDRDRLAPLVAAWSDRAAGRTIFRTDTGPGWVALHLSGESRPGLFLGALPGAVLAFPFAGPLPRELREALPTTRRDPLHDLLRDAVVAGAGLLAADLVLVIDLAAGDAGGTSAAARRRELRLQLFGSRGGCVVLDQPGGRMLWTAHPGPHPCLVDVDPARQPSASVPLRAGADALLASWTAAGLGRLVRQQEAALADRLHRRLERRRQAAARLVANLARDLERADDGEERRRDAEALAASLHTVARGQAEVTVADPRGGPARILALDPGLPPHANLERLFRLARKAERGREVVAERLDAARRDAARLEAVAGQLDGLLAATSGPDGPDIAADADDAAAPDAALGRLAALRGFATEHADLLADDRPGPGRRAPEQPARPFRRYRIDGRWEVWVGRSSEENDALTHRASHPRDLWLHAQGVGGSHVVLRTGGRPQAVPRTVLEKAAALAALHSKARHSALVPVIWTERRYVRRPRKAPPGTAVCLQEQNLFVEPGVMPGVEAD